MQDIIDQLFLILNMKAESCNTVYNYQVEHTYDSKTKHIYPRQRILKFVGGRLNEKVLIRNRIDTINYLNSELKLYNDKRPHTNVQGK